MYEPMQTPAASPRTGAMRVSGLPNDFVGIDVAVHVVVASKVGPDHRRARLMLKAEGLN